MKIPALFFSLLFTYHSSFAAGKKIDIESIRFGPEFTFWVPIAEGDEAPYTIAAFNNVFKRMKKHLTEQPPGQEFEVNFRDRNEYSVFISPNKWSFELKLDDGVTEVTMNPLTNREIKDFKDDIQDAIFSSHFNEGYFPALYGGGGHINIDIELLEKNPLLFRNFIVDFINHNELSLGIFGFDTNNAISFSMIKPDAWIIFELAIEKFDESNWDKKYLLDLIESIRQALDINDDPYWNFWSNRGSRKYYYTELDIAQMLDKKRLELRAVRPQQSADVWYRQTRLLKNRLHYLSQLKEPIPIAPILNVERLDKLSNDPDKKKQEALTPPVNPQEALAAFKQYVEEAGEKWEDHQDYIWPQWITDGELKKFNKSLECSQLLEGDT